VTDRLRRWHAEIRRQDAQRLARSARSRDSNGKTSKRCRGYLGGGDEDEAFVRSFRGAKGRWYRDLAAGGPATLELGDRRLAVQAVPANDAAVIARASREYLRKYGSSSYAQAMVKPDILSTTLRLEPR
jgi:hypothetical protein